MSTIDPLEERRRRSEAAVGSGAALVGVVAGLALLALGGLVETRALFAFADIGTDADGPPLEIFGMVIGVPLIIAGMFLHLAASRRYTGRVAGSPGIGPIPVLVGGSALGAVWGAASLDTAGLLWLIPAGLGVAAVLLGALGRAARRRRRAQFEVLTRLVTTGRIVPGRIAEIPHIDADSSALIAPVTVAYTDAAGVDRWVQKIGQWAAADLPKTGDPASVIYDPADPADESRIWVAPAESRSAEDFTRWHS